MKEILFRGKAIDGNWYYGVPLVFTEDYVCMTAPHTYNKKVEANTVGQYTGLTDKNGKGIFEWDIVKAEINGSAYDKFVFPLGVVEFENGVFGIKDVKDFTPLSSYAPRVSFEVIGNIHDNKLEDFQNGGLKVLSEADDES